MCVRGRIYRSAAAVVACGCHHQGALAPRVVDCVFQQGGGDRAAQAQVDDAGSPVCRVSDALGDGAVVPAAVLVQHFDDEDACLVAHAGNADAVVCGCGDNAGHVGAVPIVIRGVRVVVDEVIPGDELARQVRVCEVGACVHHGDEDVAAAGGDVPRLVHAHNLGPVLLCGEVGVIGLEGGFCQGVLFHVENVGVAPVRGDGRLQAACRYLNDLSVQLRDDINDGAVYLAVEFLQIAEVCLRLDLDD